MLFDLFSEFVFLSTDNFLQFIELPDPQDQIKQEDWVTKPNKDLFCIE